MAISIIQQPTQYHPAFHPVIWIADSDIKTNDQFRYIFKIQIGADIRTIKVRPRPGDGYGRVNIQQHLKDYIDQEVADVKLVAPLIQGAPVAFYNFQFGEEYRDGSGNLVTILGTQIFNRVGLNTILNRNDWLSFTEPKYKLTDANTRIMWNIDNDTDVFKDDLFFLHIAGDPGAYAYNVQEFFKDGTSNLFGAAITLASYGELFRFDLATMLSDPANTIAVSIYFQQGPSAVSETKKLSLVDSCSTYSNFKFLYLDQMGSYSSVNFDHISRRTNTSDPKTYKKFIDPENETELSRGITRYFNDPKETYRVNSDYLSDKHYKMMVDLINSDRVFLDVRSDPNFPDVEFFPVEILTKQLVEQKAENRELPQYPIDFRFSFDKIGR